MSTSHRPLFKNATGEVQLFGGEETLTWDFTSATGNPMELVVGGSTYFTFDRNGALQLESNISWNTDAGGTVGAQYDLRPSAAHIATSVAVGAISGTGDGAQLLLNKLILGHGDVDKYIDAEQGLGSTPFLRYNATTNRWEFSDDGVATTSFSAGFGTTTWDALYAADKTLLIDSTVLTFSQTSTTGYAFQFTRNLASANTDSPIVGIEQGSSGDDQPALAIGQAAAVSALTIYEGTLAGGTIRYTFSAPGQLAISSSSTLAGALLALTQNDDDQPFASATGTSAADGSKSLSTANGATADMVRVEVDTGGGANTRWIPAYSSVTLPGAPTWDSIYAGDQDLNINTSVLQWTVTSTSGYGFEILRNLGLTNTDSAIVHLENQSAADDKPTLLIEGGIGAVPAGMDVVQVNATSGGMTGGTEVLVGLKATVNEDATDVAGSSLFAYYAGIGGTPGSASSYAFFAPSGYTYGLLSGSPARVNSTLSVVTGGTIGTASVAINQQDADQAFVGVEGARSADELNNISTVNGAIGEMLRLDVDDGGGGFNTRWIPAYASATLSSSYSWDAVYSNDKTLDINSTVLTFDQSSTSGIGFTVSRNLLLASTDSPIMKVENISNGDDQPALQVLGGIGNVTTQAVPALQVVSTSSGMTAGTESMYGVYAEIVENASDAVGATLASFYAAHSGAGGAGTDYAFIDDGGFDYSLYAQSRCAIDTSNTTDSLVAAQNSTGNMFRLVDGTLAAGTDRFVVDDTGNIVQTIANYTGAVTAYTIESTSGGAGIALVRGLYLDAAGTAGDTGSYRGVDLDFVPGGGSATAYGVYAQANWNYGVYSQSPIYVDANNATSASYALDVLTSATLDLFRLRDAVAGENRFLFTQAGKIDHTPDNPTAPFDAHTITMTSGGLDNETMRGLVVSLTGNASDLNSAPVYGVGLTYTAGGGSNITHGVNIGSTWDYGIYSNARCAIDSSNTTDAFVVAQNSTGNLLRLIDGTVASGADRFVVNDTGLITITTTTDLASEALQIYQQDADQEFVYFHGTASDPAAGSLPADNLTEVNGGGVVVGPQTTSGSPDTGWAFYGMLKVKVDAVGGGTQDVWLAGYIPATS